MTVLAIDFRPHPGLLTQTREFVSSFCDTFVTDPDTTSRITMAAHELLENAVKYSTDGTTRMRIELHERNGDSFVTIQSQNHATPERAAALQDMVGRIHEATDPFKFYCELVLQSAEHEDEGGLGLARITAEADLELACNVEGDEVTIIAEAHLGATP
jgi:hypothetical protein